MFFPWYTTTMLALESSSVIGLRLARIGGGGSQGFDEVGLMLSEKVNAALETVAALMTGSTAVSIVDQYRAHVAANKTRLSVR